MSIKANPENNLIAILQHDQVEINEEDILVIFGLEELTDLILFIKNYVMAPNHEMEDTKGAMLEGILRQIGIKIFDNANCPEEYEEAMEAVKNYPIEGEAKIRYIVKGGSESFSDSYSEEKKVVH